MYLGKIVEIGPARRRLPQPGAPVHAGAAVGRAGARPRAGSGPRKRIVLTGDVPSPVDPPSGCRFRTRCPKAQDDRAPQDEPALIDRGQGHPVACHFAEALDVL